MTEEHAPGESPDDGDPVSSSDTIVLTFRVPKEYAGQRLDRFIQKRIPRLSRTRAQKILRACGFRADGRPARPSDRVQPGEVVRLVRERFEEPVVPTRYALLYRDASVIAVDKPAGLPMHPTATYHRNTLTYLLRQAYGPEAPRIVHRLDRETSGLVLCGRTKSAERVLKQAFERRAVRKEYLAVVCGVPQRPSGAIDLPLAAVGAPSLIAAAHTSARPPVRPHVCMEVRPDGGLPALTEYEVKATGSNHALLLLRPKTGRQHQLRVHLAAIGHPIVGDKLYGAEGYAPFLEYIETGMTAALEQRLGHSRQALHAHAVEFHHPESRELLRLEAPFADDLRSLWKRLG